MSETSTTSSIPRILNCQQELVDDVDEGKSNIFPLMHVDPIFNTTCRKAVLNNTCTIYVRSIFAA